VPCILFFSLSLFLISALKGWSIAYCLSHCH
jgi:hypothetical protein